MIIRKKQLLVAAVLFALLSLMARGSTAQSPGDYVIGAQDVLAISVFDQTGLSGNYAVEIDGTFSFPLIGRIKASGLTLRQFETELKKRLGDGFFKNPQVAVGVQQYRSQRIFVVGEVRQPGPQPLTGDMTLIEALAVAGLTGAASSGEVIIVRPRDANGPVLPGEDASAEVINVQVKSLQTGELGQNISLRDGDTLFVPRADSVYVFGEVKNPGAYAIQKGTTVLQALSLAGGVTPNGAMGRIKTVRSVDGKEKDIKTRLGDLVKPGDTIIVPERYF